jgi:hypothetical protein
MKNLVRRILVGSEMDVSTFDALCFNISPLPVVAALQNDDFYTHL